MAHTLNTASYTIRTKTTVLATATGIESALEAMKELDNHANVGVFMTADDGSFEMSAYKFMIWATKMNRLINQGIGWNGETVA